MNRTLKEKPKGTCALCCLDRTQLWTIVTANMVTVWLKKHHLPSRDSIAMQKSLSFRYRNVWVCRFCSQQFTINNSKYKGSSGPNDSDLSPERKQQMQMESSRTRIPFNAETAKQNYQLSLESNLRYAKQQNEEKAELKLKQEKEEAAQEAELFARKAAMSRHVSPSKPKTKSIKSIKSPKKIPGSTLSPESNRFDTISEDAVSLSSSSSMSVSTDYKNDTPNDEQMSQQIQALKARRRQVVAENATAQIANGRIAAENVRDPGSISDPIEKLAVSKINSNTPEFIFVGKWWGLPRMPHRHVEAELQFKGYGKKFMVPPSTPRIPSTKSSPLKRNSRRPIFSTGRLTRTVEKPIGSKEQKKRPASARPASARTTRRSCSGILQPEHRRPTPAPRASNMCRVRPDSGTRRVRPASARLPRRPTKSKKIASASLSNRKKSSKSMSNFKSKTKNRKNTNTWNNNTNTTNTKTTNTTNTTNTKTTKTNTTKPVFKPTQHKKKKQKKLVLNRKKEIQSNWKIQRARAKALGARERADEQVRRQHAHSERIDHEEKIKTQGKSSLNIENRQSPEKLHRWFSQASCSFDPAAVLMSHARSMPQNNDMFVGICNVITQQHTRGDGLEAAERYIAHDFAPHAVSFLTRNLRHPQYRRESYLALRICAQTQTDVLIQHGLIEILTKILHLVIVKGLETSQTTTLVASITNSESNSESKKERTDNEFGDLCRLLDVLLDPIREGSAAVINDVDVMDVDDDQRHILSDIPLIRKLQLQLWNVLKSKRMRNMLTSSSILSAENLLTGLSKY